jgi:signal transduction histidine kinase
MRTMTTTVRQLGTVVSPFLEVALPIVIVGCIILAARMDYAVGARPLDVTGAAIILLANLPLVARRTAPVVVLLVCCAGLLAYTVAGYWEALNSFGSMVALYTVAASRSRRVSVPLAFVNACVLAITAIGAHAGPVWLLLVLAAPFSLTAWTLGDVRRMLTERNRQLITLTRQLDLDRTERARRAVIEERVRIARELHDMVAHHMSVVSVQTGLARYVLESEPATARRALDTVLATTAEGLDEMRRLLQLLRLPRGPLDDDGFDHRSRDLGEPYDPAPGLQRLDELLKRIRDAGTSVDLVVSETPLPLPPGLQLCIYRVVQESLTNVLRHAGTGHARVAMHYTADEVRVQITNDGPVVVLDREVTGHGLTGMRERAGLYGGRLVAGPRAQGGFEVELVLPLAASATMGSEAGQGNGETADREWLE